MSYFTPLPGSQAAPSFAGSTLVLPQPSLASLAQLSTDLLVHNFSLERVGFLGLRDHVPAVSGLDGLPGQPLAREGISYSVEVFQNSSKSLTIVLPRSPVIRARRSNYLASIREWIDGSAFAEVLVVAGTDAALRGDEGLQSATPLRYFSLPPSASSWTRDGDLASSLKSLCPPYPVYSTSSNSGPDTAAVPAIPLFPHGGLTRKLLETLSSSRQGHEVPVSALTIYTFDTTEPTVAFFLADALLRLLSKHLVEAEGEIGSSLPRKIGQLELSTEGVGEGQREGEIGSGYDWKVPRSWETGLLGTGLSREAGTEMFG
ncbi:hypothetical protein JCM10212_004989 [Sporobolomyces blumeae]